MTDRELLALAAKAAGIEDPIWWEVGKCFVAQSVGQWNPLTDDGHALRLAVELGIELSSSYDAGENVYAGYAIADDMKYVIESKEKDPFAATRRAIVRAAAEIGEAMP